MNSTTGLTAGSLHCLARLVVANHSPDELALGFLRYEVVRRMSSREFGQLCKANLSGAKFDDLVTEAMVTWKSPNAPASPTPNPDGHHGS